MYTLMNHKHLSVHLAVHFNNILKITEVARNYIFKLT